MEIEGKRGIKKELSEKDREGEERWREGWRGETEIGERNKER